jgi:hypothetical protein
MKALNRLSAVTAAIRFPQFPLAEKTAITVTIVCTAGTWILLPVIDDRHAGD